MNARSATSGSRVHIVYTIVVFIVLASLDNAAIALIPSMIPQLEDTFGVGAAVLGILTATQIVVTAVTAVGWGYLADSGARKRLLLWGTLIWTAAMALSGYTTSFPVLLVAQI
jgi:predicted MFS family arabinose efflux permease